MKKEWTPPVLKKLGPQIGRFIPPNPDRSIRGLLHALTWALLRRRPFYKGYLFRERPSQITVQFSRCVELRPEFARIYAERHEEEITPLKDFRYQEYVKALDKLILNRVLGAGIAEERIGEAHAAWRQAK